MGQRAVQKDSLNWKYPQRRQLTGKFDKDGGLGGVAAINVDPLHTAILSL